MTPGLLGHRCGYLGGLDGVTGDHQALWLDLLETMALWRLHATHHLGRRPSAQI